MVCKRKIPKEITKERVKGFFGNPGRTCLRNSPAQHLILMGNFNNYEYFVDEN